MNMREVALKRKKKIIFLSFFLFPEEKSVVVSNKKQLFTISVQCSVWSILKPEVLIIIINMLLQNRKIRVIF